MCKYEMESLGKTHQIEEQIITWYEQNKRDFPWRHTTNPYYIWVCEIMSQQTQMSRVVGYYERFITIFPTIADLAVAQQELLLKAWEGLGYYSRVRNMQSAAQTVMEVYQGVLPSTYEALLKLKGIGTYTAASIASIAFGQPVAAVDGNVLRVYARLFEMADDISLQKTKDKVRRALSAYMSERNPSSFNQGFIELGATICTPTSPNCESCPFNRDCLSYALGHISSYPVKKKAAKQKVEVYATFVIRNQDGKVFMQKEVSAQFLHGMYLFPQFPFQQDEPIPIDKIQHDLGLVIHAEDVQYKGMYQHIFSHKIWQMHVYDCQSMSDDGAGFVDASQVPMANAHRKIYE